MNEKIEFLGDRERESERDLIEPNNDNRMEIGIPSRTGTRRLECPRVAVVCQVVSWFTALLFIYRVRYNQIVYNILYIVRLGR